MEKRKKISPEERAKDEAITKRAVELLNAMLAGKTAITFAFGQASIELGTFVSAEVRGFGLWLSFTDEEVLWAPGMGMQSVLGPKGECKTEVDVIYFGERELQGFMVEAWKAAQE